MNKSYSRINWKNFPSETTPLNEENLNKIDYSLDEIDSKVVSLDTTKAAKTEIATMIADVSFNETTGIFTFTRQNGATFTLDTKLEKIAVNFSYNYSTQKLTITLIDGTVQEIDMSSLISQYEFLDSGTIGFTADASGKVTAIVKEGSIEERHLRPNYLAEIKVESAKAEKGASDASSYADLSKSYAVGTSGITRAGDATDNSKYYCESSEAIKDSCERLKEEMEDAAGQVSRKLDLAEFSVDDNGNLIYTDDSSFVFTVDDNGYLNWEVA